MHFVIVELSPLLKLIPLVSIFALGCYSNNSSRCSSLKITFHASTFKNVFLVVYQNCARVQDILPRDVRHCQCLHTDRSIARYLFVNNHMSVRNLNTQLHLCHINLLCPLYLLSNISILYQFIYCKCVDVENRSNEMRMSRKSKKHYFKM